jgi:hypothetical protein
VWAIGRLDRSLIREADSVGTGRDEGFSGVEGPQAADFEAEVGSDEFAEVLDGVGGGVAALEGDAGGEELGAGIEEQLDDRAELIFGPEVGLDDDFDGTFIGGVDHIAYFAEDFFVASFGESAEVWDEFDLVRAEVEGSFDFVTLHVGVVRAEGKTDRSGDLDVGSFDEFIGVLDECGRDEDGAVRFGFGCFDMGVEVLSRGVGLCEEVLDARV